MATLTSVLVHRKRFKFLLQMDMHQEELEQQKHIYSLYKNWIEYHVLYKNNLEYKEEQHYTSSH